MGSPGFVAPEVVLGRPHTPAMDIYSLGTVLFILLVGRKPFNLKQTQDLSYCKLSLAEAPGLQDARCVIIFLICKRIIVAHYMVPPWDLDVLPKY